VLPISQTLKYTFRHVAKRNPWVWRRCEEVMTRERAHPAMHRVRQERLLARLFAQARAIPAYARAAAAAPERNRLDYLRSAFPLIDKSSLREDQTSYLPHGRVPRRYAALLAETSGTTGTPLEVYRSFGSALMEEAFHLQSWHWAGWQQGERQAVLRGERFMPVAQRRPPYWFEDAAGDQLFLSTRHLGRDTVAAFGERLLAYRATQLRAYPSAAYELANLLSEAGIEVHFEAVITGSEMLYGFQRERIESVFGARVFDHYGMAERVAFAAECEHGRMHVNPEYGILEIVDDDGNPTDGEGTIVGTSLFNRVMPLIRYRMNDTARWSHEACECGRTYPIIERINGRLADQLFDIDGRAVNCTVIGFAFDGMRNIHKAQVVQNAVDRWTIRIVPAAGYSQADGNRVLAKLAQQVSARVNAQIELVRDIPALPSGKYKWVVQELKRPPAMPPRRALATPSLSAGVAV
jgi:phenylacetate-CoA ligase